MQLPYFRFDPHSFILRDWLALDRTVLANERTFLAYTRTALTLVLAGLTFIRFFGPDFWAILGYAALTVGVALWLLGLKRYRTMLEHYRALLPEEERALSPESQRQGIS
ncbi:DUF202 domain-containing protein [Acidithiobacillus caldus]|jgi:putative membrane protein|uniref:DUF202 domain-containing protein n=3 Tax=Acidithiobacillus caldus TaxID=33059 RepID=F9ZNJ0_ACICS|nr:DUF202 domain-containing protein [Acidithiobacillus caldus]AEK58253.1 conserved hypothetical protein [Acidithiobacillus caldus SM-1]AIA55230.1 hypothetical protein Acaty_c1363 [Acidithiobacillus caldus ATCC 51756]AUW32864.1 DUF202 domain-containing protein [Acidithiobacillus caldus]MBU2730106.1 DUF202 domain-containing protein [Acidithiobacillus caldus]MBU2737138.1 DUF202 domain-containing protein [Acidithiobacillus caldus ATCC 51756]